MQYRTSPQQNLWLDEIVVDNFAGGGGASTGIEAAIGRPVDIAINHDPDAIAMHTINHPHTKHYCENVWKINPREVTNGQRVGLVWFSPDCKHFSKAKGSTPVKKEIRGLAWVVLKWTPIKPRIIHLENVEEFRSWGPLIAKRDKKTGRVVKLDGTIAKPGEVTPITQQYLVPDKKRAGLYFRQFESQLKAAGYAVEFRTRRACDDGAGTKRKRLFMIARCDGMPIVWPAATYSDPAKLDFKKSGKKKYRATADFIDWTIPCISIFGRKKPLAEASLRRIAKGIQRYVIDNPKPFIIRIGQQGFGGDLMSYPINQPLTTITTKAEHCLVIPYIGRQFGTSVGHRIDEPLGTITSSANKSQLVSAFLVKYYRTAIDGCEIQEPLDTITANDRFGLVVVHGEEYRIVDILFRMLSPRELFLMQGFPPDYIIDRDAQGKLIPKYKQVARCGNSVCPAVAEALVRANYQSQQIRRAA